MNLLEFYLEKTKEKGILWETDVFSIIALGLIKGTTDKEVRPQSDFPLVPLINSIQKEKYLFGHITKTSNIQKIIKLQNKKNNPISAFKSFEKEDFIKYGIANKDGSSCVFILKANIVFSSQKDALSFTEHGGYRRFIKLKNFENETNKQFIEKLRNEFWSFYITLIKPLYRKKRFIELIKLVDLNKNDLSLTKYSKQLMLNLHKILYNTEVSKEQKEFINSIKHKLTKSIFEYWKTTRSKYKKKFESAILHYLNNIHEKRRDLKTHDEFLINNFEIEKVLVTTHSLNKLTEDEKAIFMNTFKNIKLEIFEDLQQFKSTIKEILR